MGGKYIVNIRIWDVEMRTEFNRLREESREER
jgi:hypothetical protein